MSIAPELSHLQAGLASGAPRFVNLDRVAPGGDVLIERLGPAARALPALGALHDGRFVHCRARGSSGVTLEVPGHGEVVVPFGVASDILVRPNPADD